MSFNQDPNAPDFAAIYDTSQSAQVTDLTTELAEIGVTSLVGLSDVQLQEIATRLDAHRAQKLAQQATAAQAQQPQAAPFGTTPTGQTNPETGRLSVSPDQPYTNAAESTQYSPNSAAAAWQARLAQGAAATPSYNQKPGDQPGSLALSPEQYGAAALQNAQIGADPRLAAGDASGSSGVNYDVKAWLDGLLKQQAAGTYRMVNDQNLTSGSSPKAAAELQRMIQYASAELPAWAKQQYATQQQTNEAIKSGATYNTQTPAGNGQWSTPVATPVAAAPTPAAPAAPAPAAREVIPQAPAARPAVTQPPAAPEVIAAARAAAVPPITQPAPMSLTEFNAANRAGVISRAGAAGIDYSTQTVNQTVQSNYDKYLAGLPK